MGAGCNLENLHDDSVHESDDALHQRKTMTKVAPTSTTGTGFDGVTVRQCLGLARPRDRSLTFSPATPPGYVPVSAASRLARLLGVAVDEVERRRAHDCCFN